MIVDKINIYLLKWKFFYIFLVILISIQLFISNGSTRKSYDNRRSVKNVG